MERETKYLIHLLGAYLREEEPEAWPDVDWDKLEALSHMHNVVGIVAYMAMSYPICPDEQRTAELKGFCMQFIMGYANRASQAEAFSRRLSRNGIDHILMKGFILRDYFPVPELRTFGDIDLVIRPEDRIRCDRLMQDLGYRQKTDWEPVFTYIKGSELYEIHTELMEVDLPGKADCRGYFRDLWEHVCPMREHCYQFTPEYHFLYMLVHLAKHVLGSGAGIRMYLDVAAFLRYHKDTLDWDKVSRELETLEFTDFANAVLTLVRDCFGISSPIALKEAGENTVESLLDFTMRGGIFGKASRNSGINSLKKESRSGEDISRTGTLVKRLFPSARTIESRYTYLQHNPWLLPVAWVHRLVKTKDKMHRHMAEAQNILSADKDEVRKLNEFYKNIGLGAGQNERE